MISNLTIAKAHELLAGKKISARELAKEYLERAQKLNKTLNSLITVTPEVGLLEAEKVDSKIKRGEKLNFLAGIPVVYKDLFSTKGIKTTAGSKVLANYVPVYDSTVVQRLKAAGAVTTAKANQDAWGHGSSGENSDFGPTNNPYDLERVPGGSSSGSAAAVASDQCIFATGTDTGSSVRLPAAFCNLVGLKPTYGRVSRYGVIAMGSSLDSIGHFTRTVYDNAQVLSVTAGQDEFDSTCAPGIVPNYMEDLKKGVKGLKIGLPKEYYEKLDKKIKKLTYAAVKKLEDLGAKIINVSLPHTEYGIATYYIIQPSEVSSNLARYDGIRFGDRREIFGSEAKRRIILGTYTLSSGYYDAYYLKAMKVRRLILGDYLKAFEKVDVLICPSSPTLPFKIGEKVGDPLTMYLSDIFLVTQNLAGVPSLNIPCGFLENPSTPPVNSVQASSGHDLPVGMQIIGPHFAEKLLYQVAYAYEQETRWYERTPVIGGST